MISEPNEHSVIAVYYSQYGAQAAVRALDTSGFDIKMLSIVETDLPSEGRRTLLGRAPAGKLLLVARGPGELVARARETLAHARAVLSDDSANKGHNSLQT